MNPYCIATLDPYCLSVLCKLLARHSDSYRRLLRRLLIVADLLCLEYTYADLATAAATAWHDR